MIVAEMKPISEIKELVDPYSKILVVGCGTCVTVCLSGGEQQVKTLASALRIAFLREGKEKEIIESTITRQCDPEFVDELVETYIEGQGVDCLLSLGCGVGVNYLADRLPGIPVLPGENTKFIGGTVEPGVWKELCAACGECIVHLTGGICPIARCAKTMMNGPCGGTNDGKCELGDDTDCVWALIVERMKSLGTLDKLVDYQPPRDWSTARDGGPRRHEHEDKEALTSAAAEKADEG